MKKYIYFVFFLTTANMAVASNYYLKDGTYETSTTTLCSHKLINDLPGQLIQFQGISTHDKACNDTTTLTSARRVGDFTFEGPLHQKIFVDQQWINDCTPTANDKSPCWPSQIFYYSDGTLKIQLGDLLEDGFVIRILNPKAFYYMTYARLSRNGQQIDRVDEKETESLFSFYKDSQ
jgi:hypothetical protein